MADIEAYEKAKKFIFNELDNYNKEYDYFTNMLNKTNKEITEECKKQITSKLKENPKKYMKNLVNIVHNESDLIQSGGDTNIKSTKINTETKINKETKKNIETINTFSIITVAFIFLLSMYFMYCK